MSVSYEIRVKGRVSDHLVQALGMEVSAEPVETVLHRPVSGPDALHEVLEQMRDLGLELIEVRRLPPSR